MVGTSETKPCNVTSKRKENNLGKVVAPTEKPLSQKKNKGKSNSYQTSPKAKRIVWKKLAKNNSKSKLSGKFDFNPEEFLDKSLLFNLKQTSEEQIFDTILEKYTIMTNILCNIESVRTRSEYETRKIKTKRTQLSPLLKILMKKIYKTTNKLNLYQLNRTRNKLLKRYKELGETFIKIKDKKQKR